MNTEIQEVIVYTIKNEFEKEYGKVQHLVKNCMEGMKGYVSMQSFRSCTKTNQLMDWVVWDSYDSAKLAEKEFEKHPEFGLLMNYLEEMKFSDHFKN